jgi:hypothetical protein
MMTTCPHHLFRSDKFLPREWNQTCWKWNTDAGYKVSHTTDRASFPGIFLINLTLLRDKNAMSKLNGDVT